MKTAEEWYLACQHVQAGWCYECFDAARAEARAAGRAEAFEEAIARISSHGGWWTDAVDTLRALAATPGGT